MTRSLKGKRRPKGKQIGFLSPLQSGFGQQAPNGFIGGMNPWGQWPFSGGTQGNPGQSNAANPSNPAGNGQNPLQMLTNGWGNVKGTMDQVQSMIGTAQQMGSMLSPMLGLFRGINGQEKWSGQQAVFKKGHVKKRKRRK